MLEKVTTQVRLGGGSPRLTERGGVQHHEGMDAESRRAQVLRAYQEGPEAVVSLVGTLLSALTARLTALEAENARLAARLGTTSHNSRKPPSSDGPGVKPHPTSQRGRSGRASGGQPGHAGQTVRLVATPDAVQVRRPPSVGAVGRVWRASRRGGGSGGR